MTPCDFALFRYRSLALWRNLWSILLYSFGVAVVMFGIIAIVFLMRSDWLTGAVNAAGGIASGVGMSWVVTRRNEAVREEREAADDVYKYCQHTPPKETRQATADSQQKDLPIAEQSREAIERQLNAISSKLYLLGRFR